MYDDLQSPHTVEMLDLVPDAAAAEVRWTESYNAQPWVKQMNERKAS